MRTQKWQQIPKKVVSERGVKKSEASEDEDCASNNGAFR